MKYDLSALDPEEFETLCGALLTAKGFRAKRFARKGQRDFGIDFLAESADDTTYVVQAKRFSRDRVPMSDLRRVLLDLNRALTITNARMALLMTTARVQAKMADELPPAPNVLIWDGDMLEAILDQEPKLREEFLSFRRSKEKFESFADQDIPPSGPTGTTLINALQAVIPGSGWQEYEKVCVDILNYLFVPPSECRRSRAPAKMDWTAGTPFIRLGPVTLFGTTSNTSIQPEWLSQNLKTTPRR